MVFRSESKLGKISSIRSQHWRFHYPINSCSNGLYNWFHSIHLLGLPLGGYPKKLSFWQPVIDKIHLKLDCWNKYNLSRGGCLTLCNAVFANLSTYYLSFLQMMRSAITELEKIMSIFFWEGQKGSKLNHLVKWSTASKALSDGGLGLGNLKNRNLALPFKWNWRFLRNQRHFTARSSKVYMAVALMNLNGIPLGSLGLVYAAHGLVSKKYGQNLIILQPLNWVMEEELHSGKLLGARNSQ